MKRKAKTHMLPGTMTLEKRGSLMQTHCPDCGRAFTYPTPKVEQDQSGHYHHVDCKEGQ